ncbi:MAG: hypothetical protein A2171_01185 [Candidatus Levybacteria bacterium RBG_13_35_9]|nr:MAG: hypothetical protein A2171_01185 [Candidatus Levybacteria bacterium RBG_13_35_9]
MDEKISIIPLGGTPDVTKNMYVYEYKNEILLVDCGLGFADDTMLGVELLIPDVSYLKSTDKKIVGMAITHGHEDHMGGLPYILPELPDFPIYATPLTAEFANGKLKEFNVSKRVQKVNFDGGQINIGSFAISFIRVTHSVPDTSNIFIKTPAGNFFHASDFKFDFSPYDGKKTEVEKISKASNEGILCLLSDSLRAETIGKTPSENKISIAFENEMEKCTGKFLVTTYSSNIARLNQIIDAARKFGRKVCFVGRSVIKNKQIAQDLGYMKLEKGMEVFVEDLKRYKDSNLVLIVAGSQGQENSALYRMVNDDFKEVKITSKDTIVFSSDPIPGNEISINALLDSIAKKGAKAVHSDVSPDFHVSGHGATEDLILMMNLTHPKKVFPIGGDYRHLAAYKNLARKQGFADKDIILTENGQEVVFTKDDSYFGRKIPLKNVYVDEISGEEVESFVIRDRQRLAKDGVVIVMCEIDSTNGQLLENPNIIVRGMSPAEIKDVSRHLTKEIRNTLSRKKQKVSDWWYVRKSIGQVCEKYIFRNLRKRPLVLPVVIEV